LGIGDKIRFQGHGRWREVLDVMEKREEGISLEQSIYKKVQILCYLLWVPGKDAPTIFTRFLRYYCFVLSFRIRRLWDSRVAGSALGALAGAANRDVLKMTLNPATITHS
jgi:hypothetical protein